MCGKSLFLLSGFSHNCIQLETLTPSTHLHAFLIMAMGGVMRESIVAKSVRSLYKLDKQTASMLSGWWWALEGRLIALPWVRMS